MKDIQAVGDLMKGPDRPNPMRKHIYEALCPRCLSPNLKGWDELDPAERMIIERHPRTAKIPPEERKKHRFCMRCFYSDSGNVST